jgi:D-amino-acid dehydrogenase
MSFNQASKLESKPDVVVLGAGIVGISTAYYLARRGCSVTVVDRMAAPGMDTSFANGGQVSVSHAEPWANPSAPFKVIRWLLRDDAPLLFRPRLDPYQWWWLMAWMVECLPHRTRRNTQQILELALHSRGKIQEIRKEHALDYDQQTAGILHFYRSRHEFNSAIKAAELMNVHGCHRKVVDQKTIFEIEPALKDGGGEILGGTFTEADESGDAYKFTAGLARVCASLGVTFRFNCLVTGIEFDRRSRTILAVRARDLVSGHYETLAAGRYVVAMGSFSAPLLRPLGIRLNIYPAKGYSATIPIEREHHAPVVSLTDDEYKLVYSRLGDRLRIAGTAELDAYSRDINPGRCRAIIENARALMPAAGAFERAEFWTGLRPTTPSNLPYIGLSAYKNLYLNTGHGTLGWTMGPGSGARLAEMMTTMEKSNFLGAPAFTTQPEGIFSHSH